MFSWALERLDTEKLSPAEWESSLEAPLGGTTSRAGAEPSPKLLDEEMALFRAAQQAY